MSGESLYRFYHTETGEPVNGILKVGAQKTHPELDMYIWADELPEEYRQLQMRDELIFDKEGKQLVYPSNGKILQSIGHENLFVHPVDLPEEIQKDIGVKVYPSTSSFYSGVFSSDAIARWQINNAIESMKKQMIEMGYIPDADHGQWYNIISQAKEDASPSGAAERGTRWHGAVEMYMRGEDYLWLLTDEETEVFPIVIEKITTYFDSLEGETEMERSFVNHEYRYAGRSDIRKGNVVADYKFSDKPVFNAKGTFLAGKWVYPERPLQLASYAIGLEIPEDKARLVNIFCNVETGDVHFHEYSRATTERNLLAWKSLVFTWYLINIKSDKVWESQKNV